MTVKCPIKLTIQNWVKLTPAFVLIPTGRTRLKIAWSCTMFKFLNFHEVWMCKMFGAVLQFDMYCTLAMAYFKFYFKSHYILYGNQKSILHILGSGTSRHRRKWHRQRFESFIQYSSYTMKGGPEKLVKRATHFVSSSRWMSAIFFCWTRNTGWRSSPAIVCVARCRKSRLKTSQRLRPPNESSRYARCCSTNRLYGNLQT